MARAVEREGDVFRIEILTGGTLRSNKGINLPDTKVSAPSMTEKDREDILFGIGQNVDYIALSFVRKKEDVLKAKNVLSHKPRHTVESIIHELAVNLEKFSDFDNPNYYNIQVFKTLPTVTTMARTA